jgi:protein-S-isoprenylcysteine O-methyltransferase Ste14
LFLPTEVARDIPLAWSMNPTVKWALFSALLFFGFALIRVATHDLKRSLGTPDPADPTRRLSVAGIYSVIRHPMQLGQICYVIASAAYLQSLSALIYAFSFSLFLSTFYRSIEERALREKFGVKYEAYRRITPAYIPRSVTFLVGVIR